MTNLAIKQALITWKALNKSLLDPKYDINDLEQLLSAERTHINRKSFVRRIQSRIYKLKENQMRSAA